MPLNPHLRQEWRDLGYPDGMASAAVCRPAPMTHRRVYHLTSVEYAISNIVFGRLKVARFSNMNDPFELLAPKAAAKNTDMQKLRKEFDDQFGLLCFSADWRDPVLWSHYGARHRGICLGFNVKKSILRNVSYRNSRLVVTNGASLNDDLKDKILQSKFKSWEYEQESRVLVELKDAAKEGGLHFTPFDSELKLAEVVLGPLCSIGMKNTRKVVEKHHKGITVFKARLAHNSFHVVPAELTVLTVSKVPGS